MEPAMTSGSRAALAAILGLAALLRLTALIAVSPTPLVNDEALYHSLPAAMAAGQPLGDAAGRAPGVLVFHAALYRAFGPSIQVARAGNTALAIASVALLFLLGRRFGGPRAGLVAAGIAALYPALIGFSHYLYSETLYIFLLLAGLVTLVGGGDTPSLRRALAAGALFGLCALTREVGLAIPLVVACLLPFTARPRPQAGLRRAGLLLLACALVIAPWSIHLNRHSEHPVLLSRTTWINLYLGNHEGAHWRRYDQLGATRSEREIAARKLALESIAARMPAWPFEKLARNVPDFFAPTEFPVRRLLTDPASEPARDPSRIGSWAYRFRWNALESRAFRVAAAAACAVAYLLVVLSGAAGLALARDRRMALLLALLLLAHLLPVVLTFPNTRFRLPVMPLLMVAAGALAADPGVSWREASRTRRALAVVVSAGLLAMIFARRAVFLSADAF